MRKWTTPLAILLTSLLLLALAFFAGRLLPGALNAASGGNVGGEDPMFAPPDERITRPPSLAVEEGEAPSAGEDPSRNWRYETLTPLDAQGFAVEEHE